MSSTPSGPARLQASSAFSVDYYHTLRPCYCASAPPSAPPSGPRKGADMCIGIVGEPMLACPIVSIRALTPSPADLSRQRVRISGRICSAIWPWWAELWARHECASSPLSFRAIQGCGHVNREPTQPSLVIGQLNPHKSTAKAGLVFLHEALQAVVELHRLTAGSSR